MLGGERLKTATDNGSGGEVKIRGGEKNNLESANAAELLMLLLPPRYPRVEHEFSGVVRSIKNITLE